jgi:FtsH-binding integral membrane protein
MRSFVFMLICMEAQTFFNTTNAPLVLPVLAVMSLSVRLCLSTILCRQTKDFTSLMGSPPTVIGVLAVMLIFISSVFFLFIRLLIPADVVSRRVVLSSIWE